MSGALRPYNNLPDATGLSNNMADFLQWVQTTLNSLIGNTTVILPAPTVSTKGFPGAVLISWNEIGGADKYTIYETSTATPPQGLPIATVGANHGAVSNSYLRAGLADTTTRQYWVMATNNAVRGGLGGPIAGTALAAAGAQKGISDLAIADANGVGGGAGGGGALSTGTIDPNRFYTFFGRKGF